MMQHLTKFIGMIVAVWAQLIPNLILFIKKYAVLRRYELIGRNIGQIATRLRKSGSGKRKDGRRKMGNILRQRIRCIWPKVCG